VIRVEIKGLQELNVRIAAMSKRTQDLEPVLLQAGSYVLKSARTRIKTSGGDTAWPANISGTPLLFDTGRLMNSLEVSGSGNIADLSGSKIRVGTNVFYARWLQEGTGIFGVRGEPIVPQQAKALAFKIGGKMRFFKSIKGTPKRPYLYVNEEDSQAVGRIFGKYIIGEDQLEA
jgi:phage gpG-like protein